MVSAEVVYESGREAAAERVAYAPLPRVLRWFWMGSVAAFVLMLAVAYVEYRAGWPKLRWYPLLYKTWGDLLVYVDTFRLVHTAGFFNAPERVAYPPLGAVAFAFCYAFGQPVGTYLAVALPTLGGAVWAVRRALLRRGLSPMTATLFPLTLVLTSFPIARLIPQGNIELFLWIFLAGGIWAYLRGHEDAAAILWGLAAALKLYPIVFLVLLVPRGKVRAMAAGVATFVGASVLSMMYLGPSVAVAWRGSVANVFGYQGLRVGEWTARELAANHSFFTLVKFAGMVGGVSSAVLTKPYYLCGAVVFGAVYFGRVRRLPVANQILLVTTFMILLPTVSYFHTLVHLYAPWLLLVLLAIDAERSGVRVPGLKATILMFLPLFASFTLYTIPPLFLYAGMVQAALLAMLFVCAAVFPFREPLEGALGSAPV